MIPSLFGKKNDNEKNNEKDGADASVPTSQPVDEKGQSASPPGALQNSAAAKQLARATTDKINLIEVEMSALPLADAGGSPESAREKDSAQRIKDSAPDTAEASYPAAGDDPHPIWAPTIPSPTEFEPTRPAFTHSTDILLGDSMLSNAVDLSDSISNRAIEEGAILYSNGDVPLAIEVLRESIGADQINSRNSLAWLMLLELYQAIGDSKRFKNLAADYAVQFPGSSPFKSYAAAGQPSGSSPSGSSISPESNEKLEGILFKGPLSASIMPELETLKRLTPKYRTLYVDFGEINGVDAQGAKLTLRMLTAFGKSNHTLIIRGLEHLLGHLLAIVDSGVKPQYPAVWMLMFETYRLLGREEEFERKSVDYLATFEGAMPFWEPCPANMQAEVAPRSDPQGNSNPTASMIGNTGDQPTDMIALTGELVGKAEGEFARLSEFAESTNRVCVDCSELTRLDFIAAGALLNWAVGLQKNNKTIEFRRVSHLVAALLIVMGIHEFAQIERR